MKLFPLLYLTVLFTLLATGIYGLSERVDSIQRDYVESTELLHELGPLLAQNQTIEQKIRAYAKIYGTVDADRAVLIAKCESNLDPFASNKTSTAKGVYQFLDGTWEAIGAEGSPYDADESIRQFMIWYPSNQDWWECE